MQEKFEKRSFISTVSPTVHTNPSRKRIFVFENALQTQTGGIRKRQLCVLVRMKHI